ncbi:MAG: cupredoxin domain-containing protein [Thermoanaerobaculia bacterium]
MIRSSRMLLLTLIVVAFAACGPDEETADNIVNVPDIAPDTAATATDTTMTDTTGTPGAAAGSPVDVALTEYRIEMPATLPAGPVTFQITNSGTMPHNFEIEGQGIEEELPQDLQPGESGTLEADLQPGTYTIYCPVGNHRSEGMELQLTVTEAAETTTSL